MLGGWNRQRQLDPADLQPTLDRSYRHFEWVQPPPLFVVAGPLGAYARAASENVPATRPLRRCSRLALQELVPLRRPFRASTSWSLHATLPLAL